MEDLLAHNNQGTEENEQNRLGLGDNLDQREKRVMRKIQHYLEFAKNGGRKYRKPTATRKGE